MAYTDNFPQRPVFMADFANGGRIDPRMTFTRASTANVWDGKHLSSENLLLQSSDFDTTWSASGLNGTPTSGQTDPSGGTDGFTMVEDSAATLHRLYQSFTASGSFAFTVYAKQNNGTRYLTLTIKNGPYNWVSATYDLAGGSPATGSGAATTFSGLSATQTASGNSYYKCVLKATGSVSSDSAYLYMSDNTTAAVDPYGAKDYQGDGTSSIDVAFASLSTTGATDYNPTTTQIHRAYAPSLVSKSNNIGRFDHTTDGQSVAKGILVEGASTNLLTYSEDFTNAAWVKPVHGLSSTLSVSASAAIGPDGLLSACAAVASSTAGYQEIRHTATVGSGAVAFSVYAKAIGSGKRLLLREDATGSSAAFDLVSGTVVGNNSGGVGSIEAVGNGYYRCTMVCTPGSGSQLFAIWAIDNAASNFGSVTGDDYSGFLLFGAQVEQNSFSSSYIKSNSGSATTRALESLSMTDSGLFDNGGGTIVAEYDTSIPSSVAGIAAITDGAGSSNAVSLRLQASTAKLFVNNSGSTQAATSTTAPSAGVYQKIAGRYAVDDFGVCVNGGSVVADANGTVPVISKLEIGTMDNGSYHLNGHVKRVAIYPALTDTNLQALTS